jgi:hypothetical protein
MTVRQSLEKAGVRTMADLDAWIKSRPQVDSQGSYLLSRHDALTFIVGQKTADAMLQELAICQCC